MANFPQVMPYIIDSQISTDPFYTNYSAKATHNDSGASYIITEFNPTFMVTRTEEGALEPTERFLMEFESALERFSKLCDALKNLNEPFIFPVEDILQLNNTIYLVRLSERYQSLEEAMLDKKLSYSEAYVFIRPLIQSLITASKKGLIFQFEPGAFRMDPYGQLMLNSMFAWEGHHRNTIMSLMQLFYRLVAGVPYNHAVPVPSVEDLYLPARLTTALREALSGEAAYGSIDDFNKQLRTIMNTEGDKDVIYEKPIVTKKTTVVEEGKISKPAAAGIFGLVAVLVLVLVGGPLAWFFVISPAMSAAEYALEAEAEAAAVMPFVRLHTAYAVTDPADPTIMLNGSFYQSGGRLFHRLYQDGYNLAVLEPGGTTTILAQNVRPAFITVHGRYVYFCDGLEDYNIRRVPINGGQAETLVRNTASFLRVHNNMLYYTNHSNRDFLYRLDLGTMQTEQVLAVSAYETVVSGTTLYFINGSSGFGLYSADLDGSQPQQVMEGNFNNLRFAPGHLFFRDVETGEIIAIHLAGTTRSAVHYLPSMPVQNFDVYYSTIVFTDADNEVWFLSTFTGEEARAGTRASYVTAVTDGAYVIDAADSRVVRRVMNEGGIE